MAQFRKPFNKGIIKWKALYSTRIAFPLINPILRPFWRLNHFELNRQLASIYKRTQTEWKGFTLRNVDKRQNLTRFFENEWGLFPCIVHNEGGILYSTPLIMTLSLSVPLFHFLLLLWCVCYSMPTKSLLSFYHHPVTMVAFLSSFVIFRLLLYLICNTRRARK